MATRARNKKSSNNITYDASPNSKLFHTNVPHKALYQNCTNGSAPLNQIATGAKNINKPFKQHLLTQIQNTVTQMFPIVPTFKIAPVVLLH